MDNEAIERGLKKAMELRREFGGTTADKVTYGRLGLILESMKDKCDHDTWIVRDGYDECEACGEKKETKHNISWVKVNDEYFDKRKKSEPDDHTEAWLEKVVELEEKLAEIRKVYDKWKTQISYHRLDNTLYPYTPDEDDKDDWTKEIWQAMYKCCDDKEDKA